MGPFSRSKFAIPKALKWSRSDAEFVKRAGLVIMAAYGSTDKEAENDVFQQFFPVMVREPGTNGNTLAKPSIGLCDKPVNATRTCVWKQ